MNEQLQKELFDLLKEEVKDLWEKEDEAFLLQLATDAAKEKFLSAFSNTEEHQMNLIHLAVTLRGEIARKQLKIKSNAMELFVRILIAVIKTVALSSFKLA